MERGHDRREILTLQSELSQVLAPWHAADEFSGHLFSRPCVVLALVIDDVLGRMRAHDSTRNECSANPQRRGPIPLQNRQDEACACSRQVFWNTPCQPNSRYSSQLPSLGVSRSKRIDSLLHQNETVVAALEVLTRILITDWFAPDRGTR